MKNLDKLTVDEIKRIHTLLKETADLMNVDNKTMTQLSADGEDDALQLALMEIKVFSYIVKNKIQ